MSYLLYVMKNLLYVMKNKYFFSILNRAHIYKYIKCDYHVHDINAYLKPWKNIVLFQLLQSDNFSFVKCSSTSSGFVTEPDSDLM